MRRWGVLPVVLLAAAVAAPATGRAAQIAFRSVAPGIGHASLAGGEDAALEGHAFEVDLSRTAFYLVPAAPPGTRASVGTIAAQYPQHLAVNASFFDEAGQPLGVAVSDGRNVGGKVTRRWSALVIESGSARIVPGDLVPSHPTLAVQGVPRLVVDGAVPTLKRQSAPRTAVCADGVMLTVVVATQPVDADAFARALARPRAAGGLGCRNALNLDGGGSTQLSVRLPGLSLDVAGAWNVPNALVIVPAAAR